MGNEPPKKEVPKPTLEETLFEMKMAAKKFEKDS